LNLENLGKIILLFALMLLITGSLLYFFGKVLGITHLPGDIQYRKGDFSFHFPLGASILISILLTVVLNIVFIILRNR